LTFYSYSFHIGIGAELLKSERQGRAFGEKGRKPRVRPHIFQTVRRTENILSGFLTFGATAVEAIKASAAL